MRPFPLNHNPDEVKPNPQPPLNYSPSSPEDLPTAKEPSADLRFICQRCNACCRWPGFVRLSELEIERLAHHLDLDISTFLERYTELLPSRSGLTLRSYPDHTCILFAEGGCLVHEVKPDQCKAFPNGWNFPGWQSQCKAIPSEG